ncbi:MAG TPA: GNAT family N-acetyltransferase [bacterium]|nr:GNAT family N-acetyltransferase [bacterium]
MIGQKTLVRPLDRADCDRIASWKPVVDPLMALYVIPERDRAGWDQWFKERTQGTGNRAFAIETEDQEFVGFILLTKVDEKTGGADIHVQIDPDRFGQGLATDGLRTFLEIYFGKWSREMLTVVLPCYHTEGRRFLQASSFIAKERIWRPEPRGTDVLSMPALASHRRFFRVVAHKTEVQCSVMELNRLSWISKRGTWKSESSKPGK